MQKKCVKNQYTLTASVKKKKKQQPGAYDKMHLIVLKCGHLQKSISDSLLVWSFQIYKHNPRKEREWKAMTLKEQLLPLIKLGRAMRPFPSYLKSIILQRERLFTSGKHSRQVSIFPEWTSQQIHQKARLRMLRETAKKNYMSDSVSSNQNIKC